MLVHTNRSQTVYEIAAAARISHGTCQKILSDVLNMSHVTQHGVPRVLMQDRDNHMCICDDLIDSADKDDGTFLTRIITGDERRLF
jgi:hypothetical protein